MLRTMSLLLLSVVTSSCELPDSGGPAPSGAAMVGPSTSKPTSDPAAKSRTKPPLPPKTDGAKGEETGALIGLRAGHDELRTALGVAKLEWSPSVAVVAQDWAKQLAAGGCQLSHRPNGSYGENLYWSSSPVTAAQVVEAWASEREHYDAATHTCTQGVCGHYTQMVWSATTQLGCGMASCGNAQVWVCNYDPRGNVVGQQPY